MADVVSLEEVKAALNLSDTSKDSELGLYIDAATEYIESQIGTMPSATYTETVTATGDTIYPIRGPIISVTSLTPDGGSAYTTGFTVGNGNYSIQHDNLFRGDWTLVYVAGFTSVPADLKLAVLEDIRGLYQPGQIGPPAAFGAFGIENTDTGPTYRPVRQWPRVDAWISSRFGPVVA